MKILGLTENDAKEMCTWKYEEPYHIYNLPSWDETIKNNWSISSLEKREKEYRKIVDENGEFLGYFRYKFQDNKIILGLGMKPENCGKNIGNKFMNTILDYLKQYNTLIELEVRSFNTRAIKCYEKVGFKVVDKVFKKTLAGEDEFIVMQIQI